ncbi:putative inorganic phosphate cotransporter [Zophobas morio]|uniref:putative inorganic phosphate cotransporter n=1 Tax=Zophobas morio TaxID=2755281 RepID=UPI003083D27D
MTDVEVSLPQPEHPGEVPAPSKIVGIRHYQYLLFVLTFVVFFGIYSSLSVAIVPMTGTTSTDADAPKHVDWTNPDTVLSAFFWAYFIPHSTGAKLTQLIGAKWLLLTTMFIGSVFNIVIPAMSDVFGSSGVIACRVAQGLCQGFLYPCINSLVNVWTPACERTRVLNLIYGCAPLGTAICMPLAGLLAGSETGWPLVFSTMGGAGIVWAIIFAFFSEHSPSTHSRISEEEKQYIEQSSIRVPAQNMTRAPPTPWVAIVKSVPVWAILMAGSAHCWGQHTMLTQIPSYMHNFMDYDITKDGEVSSLPYVAQLGVSLIAIPITDIIISKKITSTTTKRKIFNSLGCFIPAVFLLALAFIDRSERISAVALLVVAVGTSVFAQSGYVVNATDLAPNHAAVMLSLVSSYTTIYSVLGPLTVGFLGRDKADPTLWRDVFLISASIYTVCGIFYCVFASTEKQPWNEVDPEELGTAAKIKQFCQKLWSRWKSRVKSYWNSTKRRLGCSTGSYNFDNSWLCKPRNYFENSCLCKRRYFGCPSFCSCGTYSFENSLKKIGCSSFCSPLCSTT